MEWLELVKARDRLLREEVYEVSGCHVALLILEVSTLLGAGGSSLLLLYYIMQAAAYLLMPFVCVLWCGVQFLSCLPC